MAAEIRTMQFDLAGLLRVLGSNLYSTHDVVIRELVQNAHDSCIRRRVEDARSFEPRITIEFGDGVLTIADNGAGLTRAEILEYLATVGRGYTGRLREQGASNELIGAFGLGFLSAFFVSDRVELTTTSYQDPESGWRFVSLGGERFEIDVAEPGPIGTRVSLSVAAAARELLDPAFVSDVTRRYCGLLPIPVCVGGSDEPVNSVPPWRDPGTDPVLTARARLAFARGYEAMFEPLCAFDVKGRVVRGILWIQDGRTYGTSDRRNLHVYVRGMQVTSDARHLLPEWAGFVGGVVESDDLVPTASREDLLRNAEWTTAAEEIGEALVSGLLALCRDDAVSWRRVLARHSEQLLGACLCDDRLFASLADELGVPTTEGSLPVASVRRLGRGRVHVSLGDEGGYEEVLFRALRVPVVLGVRYGALPFCRRWTERFGGEVVQLGTAAGNRVLFSPASLPADDAARLAHLLGGAGRTVVPARFAPTTLPVVLVPDRDAALKRRIERDDADQRMGQAVLGLVRLYTDPLDDAVEARLYVNVDSPLVQKLSRLPEGPRERLAAIIRAMADLVATGGDDTPRVDLSETLEGMTRALLELVEP
jgi:molecular chaperone HtpG